MVDDLGCTIVESIACIGFIFILGLLFSIWWWIRYKLMDSMKNIIKIDYFYLILFNEKNSI